MLPGFRFLFAAIVLSTSILVFGLGAAALLRATHEQYVSAPSWRNGPREQVFAQASEPAQPVLAVLRAEPDMAEPAPNLRDQVPTIGLPASGPDQVAALTTEADAQPQVSEAPADASSAEPAKTEASKTEATATDATVEAAAPTDTLTPADTTASIPEAKPAATASEPAPAGADAALASAALDVATAKLAALNAPATTTTKDAPPKAKVDSGKADDKAAKKAKAKKRHRVVRRPPPQQLQQQLDPFGQPQAFATTARTR
ncbi:hypothetical protein JQ617_12895 [Bradyrhizobium sp. KB893862 SZCCT0404]|uniref:hypothetical protein n=1 Tax=Bradyrhizobium sp. KB893862 SZCCT0404 TaxID=2807672 RepID=UPI001BA75D86|nr:hypothetical protein [Bradyrhizobium sp. KB893862 SZCCT0404]MBR1174859.1 hypothetical protein [Bradyrhizobium sp. KB893862 SZCCT0404]